MLVALELTPRQAVRLLAQAVQTRAKIEIDPRPEFLDTPLWGAVESRQQDLLVVQVLGAGNKIQLGSLTGAMCDVRSIIAGQLYMFASVIVEVSENTAPPRISLAVPDSVQVANRRRFARKSPTEPISVRITTTTTAQALSGEMTSVSRTGIGCRVPHQVADEQFFIGDEARVEFVLPWLQQVYSMPAITCNKNACQDHEHVVVGFEFAPQDAAAKANLELLRVALDNETQRLVDLEGAP